ncbi:hypothetical protein FRC00_003569 [Tulasnella sp. 408]|nr:hypothetical protein FRC00_003569 [Tulasnella sp. 408]
MGVRHQIYIIANVLGLYRIVVAYHIQWLEPPRAVKIAWNLLQHVKKHAGPLEKELQCLQQRRYHKNGAAFPFYAGEDNNSGFTVIDVTDSFSPAYCFWGRNEDYGFPAGHPIDPEGYATRYYTDEKLEFEDLKKEEQDAILALQGERFIGSRRTLNEAWDNRTRTLDEMDDDALSQDAKEFTEALRTVIKAGSTGNAQQMADALSSTAGVVEGLRRTLHRERLPKCCDPAIVKGFLIAQDLSNSSELDLSWMQLSPAQVLKVVRAVLQDDSFKICSLDISGNSDVTEGTLSNIFKLPKAGEIKRLYLFGCPKVEDVRRVDMPGRIGMEEGAEVFNSYFPAYLSEYRPWKTKPGSGKPRPRV